MEKHQFLLLKLSEECAEVSQRAIKQIQFGALEVQTGQGKDNAERLHDELVDLLCIIKMLIDDREISSFDIKLFRDRFEQKKEKLQKYLDYSFELGELPEIKL